MKSSGLLKGRVAAVLCGWICAASAGAAGAAALELGAPFADAMVLQQGRPVPVWGTAAPGAEVSVRFGEASATATADATGRWRASLPSLAAAKEGRALVVSSAGETRTLRDVLVGEVWLASGQSNMECAIWNGNNMRFRDREGGLLVQYVTRPFVRFCEVSTERHAVEPRTRWEKPAQWRPIDRGNVVMGARKGLSAVAYYFALELYAALDVPIGIVAAVKGGSNIDAWTPREGIATRPDLKDLYDFPVAETLDPKRRRWPISDSANQPTVLWNSMLAPLGPFAMRGAIWYQGESNVADGDVIAGYGARMKALHDGWRRVFGNPRFRLYFCQLCPWGDPRVPQMQEAQQAYAQSDPDAGMAVLCDVGNLRDIHPNDKQVPGLRLALLALRRDYGFSDVVADSPTLRTWRVEGGKFVMAFNDVKAWSVYDPDWRTCRDPAQSADYGFEVAGADGAWAKAQVGNFRSTRSGSQVEYRGQIEGVELVVWSDAVKEPVRLRYLHSRPWRGCLMNEAGLPLGAFHIDAARP